MLEQDTPHNRRLGIAMVSVTTLCFAALDIKGGYGDNAGHYEPGNLRWTTPVGNQNNTRVSGGRAKFIAFRKAFPGVRYADATLARLLRTLAPQEIVERWKEHSHKPKGKYGTFSTLGPYRGSLPTED